MPAGALISRRVLPPPTRLILVVVLFALTARAALALSDLTTDHIACIWLANGVVLGFLMTSPRRHWTAYLLAAALGNLIANWDIRTDVSFYLVLTLLNVAEIAFAAYPLRATLKRPDLSKREALLPFVGYGVIWAPLATAVMAGIAVSAFYGTPPLRTAIGWFASDALGIGIVTPVVLVALRGQMSALFARPLRTQTILHIAGLTAVAIGVFAQTTYPLLFLIPPAMLWVGSRLGHVGVAVVVPILTCIALIATLTGHGPAALNATLPVEHRVQITQLFVFSSSLLAFWFASIEAERRRVTDELRISVEKLAQLAVVDGLTGLINRRGFDEALAREWRRAQRHGQPLSLVMIDVDHFKAYNDHYGHLAGDDCLKQVADEIAACLKRPVDLAVRYGGEEFALLLPGTDTAGAARLAETVRRRVETLTIPHAASRTHLVVTVSIGSATYDPHAGEPQESLSELAAEADEQLYAAKRAGRNRASVQEFSQRQFRLAV